MKWPKELVLIRHGESLWNAMKLQKEKDPEYRRFRQLYERDEQNNFKFSKETVMLSRRLREKYTLPISDAELPLTSYGKEQAYKTGRELAKRCGIPNYIFVSPYCRARETLKWLMLGWPKLNASKVIEDERIRERTSGLLDLYNDWRFLNVVHPEQAKLFQLQGRVYYRLPQGESMLDVQFRSRQVFQTLVRECRNKRVLIVSHGLTILCMRSLLERWSPGTFVKIDASNPPKNCSVIIYKGDSKKGKNGKLVLMTYNKIYY